MHPWHLCGPLACLLIALCTEYMMLSLGHLSFSLPSVTYTTAWCHRTPGYSRPLPFRLYCARTQKHAYLLDKNRQKQNKSSPTLTEASSLGFYTEKGLGCETRASLRPDSTCQVCTAHCSALPFSSWVSQAQGHLTVQDDNCRPSNHISAPGIFLFLS